MINQNLARGVLLALIALFFLVQAPGLKIGTLSRPAPGLFPFMVAGLLLAISLIMILRAIVTPAVKLDFRVRNIALIGGGLVAFALVSEYVNMVAGIAVMATMASAASPDFSVRRTAVIIAALIGIAFAMSKGIGVNLPLL